MEHPGSVVPQITELSRLTVSARDLWKLPPLSVAVPSIWAKDIRAVIPNAMLKPSCLVDNGTFVSSDETSVMARRGQLRT